jgi:hypothetical protein
MHEFVATGRIMKLGEEAITSAKVRDMFEHAG